ncbi:Integrase core domain (plasmid) [Mycoplasmopsis gallopavonis]|uniref:Integrase core domain n=1 Tax=Mycoplasmopsis gallopavonis TaxID=76629 RepID=A0A449B094_9BACT|nr:DDE-type integrase/transposase/recombinase [Mycoplasmopsis gallopavonis]VEU73192.1 Integrase core domain [Mycoplasmopsis gallopavonis]
MRLKQFTKEQKLKYIHIYQKEGFEIKIKTFVEDFWERYQIIKQRKKGKHENPYRRAKALLKSWIKIYNSNMNNLESKSGKNKKPNSGRRKRVSINELCEEDRDLYQDIMEEILEERGIKQQEIFEKIRKRKEEKSKQFRNISKISLVLKLNRTSFYYSYSKKEKIDKKKYIDHELINWINLEAKNSNFVIGRDKLYQKYLLTHQKRISSYLFRLNYEFNQYKSRAYQKKKSKKNKEVKFSRIWASDLVQGNFKSNYFGEKLHADIKFIKTKEGMRFLHVITETFSNTVLNWTLSDIRDSASTIKLVQDTLDNHKVKPTIFHSDHGIEYANFAFSKFLKNVNTKQSMSPKGNSLANRPSEFIFALVQRELLDFYETNKMLDSEVNSIISKYFSWYSFERPQSNLNWKTPHGFLTHATLSV